jgi:hypothetical protein
MARASSENPSAGRAFERLAFDSVSRYFGVEFESDCRLSIGNPPKQHRFDLVSTCGRYVGEYKNYTWTEGGNVPSAKMAFLNEAVLYLHQVPEDTVRFVVVRRDNRGRHSETLAEYYCRTYSHLLNGMTILELDPDTGDIRRIDVQMGQAEPYAPAGNTIAAHPDAGRGRSIVPRTKTEVSPPSAADFERELAAWFAEETINGAGSVVVRAGDLHKRVGGYPGPDHRMPVCCGAMRRAMGSGDEVLAGHPAAEAPA